MSARTERLLFELAAAMREEIGALPENILTLGEEVKMARSFSRMSLQEVADASGFTKSHVWEVEKGRARNPTIGMVSGLSKALGVPFLRLAQAALNSSEAQPIEAARFASPHGNSGSTSKTPREDREP